MENKLIEEICSSRTHGHNILFETSEIYKNMVEMTQGYLGAKRKGGIDMKHKVLMLLAMHAASGTQQSIEYAVTSALQCGASESELMDALDLAVLTGGGNAVARAQFAAVVWRYRLGGAKKEYLSPELLAAAR